MTSSSMLQRFIPLTLHLQSQRNKWEHGDIIVLYLHGGKYDQIRKSGKPANDSRVLFYIYIYKKSVNNVDIFDCIYKSFITSWELFALFHCLHYSSICVLVQLLVEYGNDSNKCRIQQRCSTYQREVLISMWAPKREALIRGFKFLFLL